MTDELKEWQDRACNNLHELNGAKRELAELRHNYSGALRSIREHGALVLELQAARKDDVEAMRAALEAMEKIKPWAWTSVNACNQWDDDCRALNEAIAALRQRLEVKDGI